MKKLILSTVLLLGISLISFSQTTAKVAFGINSSRLNTDNGAWSNEARIGWQAGGSWLMGNKFYVEPGVYWATISSNMVHKDSTLLSFDSKINMFRIPVFAGYHLVGNASDSFFNLRVFGGPSMSFITSVTESEALKKDDFSKVLWGVDAGVGINVWWLFLDMGYEWGLNNVYSHDEHGTAKAKAFWANLGIRFKL